MPFLGKTPTKLLDANVNIDGGNIDGTTIGSSSAAAGTFTNLTATGTLTLPNDGISGDDINGGTISNFASTGIDDNATSTAITIDSSQNTFFSSANTHAASVNVASFANTTTGQPVAIAFSAVADNTGLGNEGGIYFDAGADGSAADNQLQFNADHQSSITPDMVITGSGNVGIGTTSPSTILANVSASATGLAIESAVPAIAVKDTSAADDVGYIYQNANDLNFLNYAGGNTIFTYGSSYTEAMRIDSSGNVGIGTTSPANKLDVNGILQSSSVGNYLQLQQSSTDGYINMTGSGGLNFRMGSGFDTRMTIDSSGNVGIGTTATANTRVYVRTALATDVAYLADNSTNSGFKVKFNSGSTAILNDFNAPLIFGTNDTERMRIDSSGNLLVGKTAASGFTLGAEIKADGVGQFTADNNPPLYANRKSSNGDVIVFAKDNTTVGSIGVYNGNEPYFARQAGTTTGIKLNAGYVTAATSTGADADGTQSLGSSSARWLDLYLSGNVRAGTTSLSGKLQASQSTNGTLVSYLQHTGTNPFGINIDFNVSNPNNTTNYFVRGEDASAVEFHIWSDGSFVQASDRRLKDNIVDAGEAASIVNGIQVREFDKGETHHSHGFIAQELNEVYPEVCVAPREEDGDKGAWGVNYPRMVPLLVKAIQEQQAMIEELKAEVAALKGA